ncbi:helix-turn-helix domain-containing protein [Oceanibaculum pacificum]|uniref:Transcriptional regulator n=1 Tax=Oceanibaculum pacificum TaxID=580166 RepID=A0A154VS30_9PROT|nr:helix-turn-helix domain-containing protein [Oceanibaculum pacificum]KZD04075.1 transcriptional regulator [Oceanibaculum pacificum]
MGDALPHSYFSTDRLGREDKFPVWRDSVSVIYQADLTAPGDEGGFHALADGYLFGAMSQIRCRASRQHFKRDRMRIDRDGIDHYMIQLFMRGRCHARTPQGDVAIEAGDICVFDNAQTLDTTNDDFDLLALFVPRSLLAPHIKDADHRHYQCIRENNPLTRLLRTHMLELQKQAPYMTLDQGGLAVSPTIALLAAALNGNPHENESGEQAIRMAIVTMLKRYIEENIEDSALSPESVAEIFGVSRSRLYKLFQHYNGVAAYIRDRRLAHALTILTDPTQQQRKIIDVSLSVGFSSESSFIRAFRRRYGFTPSEARQAGACAYLPGGGLDKPETGLFGDREWECWIRSLQA